MRKSPDEVAAEKIAAERLHEYNLTALPVCPFKVAERLEFEVRTRDSGEPGVNGFLMRVGNEFGIFYSSRINNDGLIRFTVAHELGHYFLPGHVEKLFSNGNQLHKSRDPFTSNDRHERQADCFASAFLMPEHLFVPALREAGAGFEAVQHLSDLCITSLTATAIRYAKLAEDPVAVIVSTKGIVDYCFMSGALEDLRGLQWLRKGDSLPARSVSDGFAVNGAPSGSKAGYSSLGDWFEGAPDIEMNEDVQGLGRRYGKTLTVLHTEEALEVEDEFED